MVYNFIDSLEVYQLVLLAVMGLALLIQLVYYVFIYGKVGRRKQAELSDSAKWPAVSVVICARNEYENLEKNLPLIAEQDYPNFEVVVVDDCSDDDSHLLLKRLKATYPHLRQTFIKKDDKFMHGKKLALTIGLKSALYETVILTDADCTPKSNLWLKHMVNAYDEQAEVVLGYCGFESKAGFLNRLIRCDAFFIGLNYLGLALCGLPYMGVGRNLSYKRSLFFKNRGFAKHHNLVSGDDDLFVNEVARSRNTKVAISKDALLVTKPKSSMTAWIQQKIRHGTTYKRYRLSTKISLSVEMASRLLFFALAILLTFILPIPYVGLAALLLRFIVINICFKAAINKLQERGLWMPMLLFDIISPFLYLTIFLKRKFTPKLQQWR